MSYLYEKEKGEQNARLMSAADIYDVLLLLCYRRVSRSFRAEQAVIFFRIAQYL